MLLKGLADGSGKPGEGSPSGSPEGEVSWGCRAGPCAVLATNSRNCGCIFYKCTKPRIKISGALYYLFFTLFTCLCRGHEGFILLLQILHRLHFRHRHFLQQHVVVARLNGALHLAVRLPVFACTYPRLLQSMMRLMLP